MIYQNTSVKEVVGRVIRRTGLKDSSLIPDLHEWIAEAMELLQTTVSLEQDFKTVEVHFHKAKFPCGLTELWAVEYCGTRLRYNNGVRDPRTGWVPSEPESLDTPVFQTHVTKQNTPKGNYLFVDEMKALQTRPWNALHWYKIDRPHVITSFEDGEVTLFFGKVPTDKEGFLMIPDEGNYKEALTWFLQARLAGRGYRNPEYTAEQMDAKFEQYAGRAIERITYPTVDQMQATTDTLSRLLPDLNYYESIFTTIGPETTYGL